MRKKKILVLSRHYWPAYKEGGPIRTLVNLVEAIGDDVDFYIITSKADIQNQPPFELSSDRFIQVGKAHVYYLAKNNISSIFKAIRKIDFDRLHCVSSFSLLFTILPLFLRRLGMIKKTQVIVSPKGEFSKNALKIKKFKKKVYIFFAKLLGIYKNVIWVASSEYEKQDIMKIFPIVKCIHVLADIPTLYADEHELYKRKQSGSLNIVFLSRISKMENLCYALSVLSGVRGKVIFDIYGPVDDQSYWENCLTVAKTLPSNIVVNYNGVVSPNCIGKTLSQYDLFFLPTLGEAFCHAIFEAFSSGCPVLISDQTLWRGLKEKGIGWDLSLNVPGDFTVALREMVDMDEDQHKKMREAASAFANDWLTASSVISASRKLFGD
jgi:glycosyltransferase involved in cell wall biosynthesis